MTAIYRSLSDELKSIYNERVYKIPIDGGFTCPNRDGKKGFGGCAFCNEKGSGEHTLKLSIKEQMLKGIEIAKQKGKGNKFIAYFQNFSSTYADIDTLKKRYSDALVSDEVVGLAIATRPDCITYEIAQVIKMVAIHRTVWVELGLQTANEGVASAVNRCYKNQDFIAAVKILNDANIPVVVHLIIGLEGEDLDAVKKTVDFINSVKIDGIKIHSLFVLKNTALGESFLRGEYQPITREFYVEAVAYILTHIPKTVTVHRLTGDGEKSQILAPAWTMEKKKNLNSIKNYMSQNGLTQGCFYEDNYAKE